MKMKIIPVVFLLLFSMVFVSSLDGWNNDTSITGGLVNVQNYSTPEFFYIGNEPFLIVQGSGSPNLKGFQWNGTFWEENSVVISGLEGAYGGRYTSFYLNDELHLIHGDSSGFYIGYDWNGSGWDENSSLVAGISNLDEILTRPEAFVQDGNYAFITAVSGFDVVGGYSWNGTSWISNSSVYSGDFSSDNGKNPRDTMYIGSDLYLVSGYSDGTVKAYLWNETEWNEFSELETGLYDVGGYSAPTIFSIDNVAYMIVGNADGEYYGFSMELPSEPSVPVADNYIQGTGEIYNTFRSTGAGLGKFLEYMTSTLPLLIIGLGIVGVIVAFGLSMSALIRSLVEKLNLRREE